MIHFERLKQIFKFYANQLAHFTPVHPSVRPLVHPDIDTWFVRLSPPTVLELQL
jgi:hypothetical protein